MGGGFTPLTCYKRTTRHKARGPGTCTGVPERGEGGGCLALWSWLVVASLLHVVICSEKLKRKIHANETSVSSPYSATTVALTLIEFESPVHVEHTLQLLCWRTYSRPPRLCSFCFASCSIFLVSSYCTINSITPIPVAVRATEYHKTTPLLIILRRQKSDKPRLRQEKLEVERLHNLDDTPILHCTTQQAGSYRNTIRAYSTL